MKHTLALRIAGLSLALAVPSLVAGCGPKGESEHQPTTAPPPGGSSATSTVPATGTTPGQPKTAITDLSTLDTTKPGDFAVHVGTKSLDVIDHYDAELTKQGWKKWTPTKPTQPGQRKWISVPMGQKKPVAAYEAAWQDPSGGKIAVVNIWQDPHDPTMQKGTFEIMDKSQFE